MTKFLKKIFICGVLLSSVNAYCAGGAGLSADFIAKLEDGKLTLSESSVEMQSDVETHTDIVIGALDGAEGLSKVTTSGNETIEATDFPIATTSDGNVWKYYDGSSALDVIPVGGGNAVYKTYGTSNQYICSAFDTTNFENKLYEKFSDGKWYVNTNSSNLTSAGETEVQVIDLEETGTPYSLGIGATPALLFNGILAKKGSDGVWYKGENTDPSDGGVPLPKVTLSTGSKQLTIGDKQEEISGAAINTLDDVLPALGEPTQLNYAKNTSGSTIKFTEFATVSAGSTLQLLDAQDSNYEKVEVSPGSFKTTDINNPIFETKAVFEPGSEAGTSNSPVSISGGTIDLGQYLQKDDTVTGNDEGKKLNLTIAGNVDVFSGIVPSTAQASDKSAAIDMFNESSVSGVFQGISGTFNVDVPYTYNVVGGTAYDDIDRLVNDVQSEDKVSLNIASKAKVGGLFSGSSTITYTMNGKPTENLSALVDETIAYAHDRPIGEGVSTQTVFLDVSSVKKFDDTFKSDEYFYSGEAGQQAVNVIPLDGDAYVIPYNDKSSAASTGESITTFDLKASTNKNSDAIRKYIEPKMVGVSIKTATGEDLTTPPSTINYSTELSNVGASGSNKVLFMNADNNNLNKTVSLNGSYLNVKSKTGDDIKIGTLALNNGSTVNLYGNNTVQDLVMDSDSTLRIKGKFTWGQAAS